VVRRANAPVDPVIDQPSGLDIAPVTEPEDNVLTVVSVLPGDDAPGQPSHLPAFMLGTVIGALAGALLGTLVSPHTRAYLVGLYQLVSRRMTSAERDKLRFELLLQ
jgi:hypothetical protein